MKIVIQSLAEKPIHFMEPKQAGADSIKPPTGIPNRPPASQARDIIIVLCVSWIARLAFVCMVSPGARSYDAFSWEHQAEVLNLGINPYQANSLFNWPPFWMQFVFLISKIANFLNVPFFRVLQFCIILIESAVIVQVIRLMRMIAPAANVRAIAIIGIALNPVAILLVCQHCNFDVLMVLWVLLATEYLLRYSRSNNLIDWLCACLFLGLGILTKTVPMVLVPLLAGGFRKATASGRLLGTALVLGPVALGMSVIYVLAPSGVLHNVVEYRGRDIFFGFPGFLHAIGRDDFAVFFDDAFYVLGIGILALTWHYVWKHNFLGDCETVVYIALLFLSIPLLGPGYATQYFYWFLPFLVISYGACGGLWRKLLIGFAIISAITFIIDYGLDRPYGFNFLYIMTGAPTPNDLYQWAKTTKDSLGLRALQWERWTETPVNETMVRIPLLIAMLTVLVFGGRILLLRLQELRKWLIGLVGLYSFCLVMIFAGAFGATYLWPGPSIPDGPGKAGQNAVQN